MAVAKDLGLDMDKLAKDMESPDFKAGLDETMQLADALQINGTPTFVLGQDLVVGAVGYDQLRARSLPFTNADASSARTGSSEQTPGFGKISYF